MTEHLNLNSTAKASYADLFFRLLDPAFLLDGESLTILEHNDAGEKALGLDSEQLKGRNFLDWIPEELHSAFQQQVRITLRRYHPREHETWILSKNTDEKRLYRCALCQLSTSEQAEGSENPTLLQVIAHDITAQRQAEENASIYLKKLESTLSELKEANNRLEELSVTDELTQVSNVRFKKRLETEHQRSRRFERPYCIVFFDIDNFKHYNDRNGHPAGDRLLRLFAQTLKNSCRETDFIARYGGEEFVILATETSESQGLTFAERLRTKLEETAFEFGEFQPLGKISASIGVAAFPEAAAEPQALLNAADAAMYHSKKTGKNRVTGFSQLQNNSENNPKRK